ncbi:unnamed protein product [Paramecium sonneborni]|uniref:Ubiquitin-like protease family profile domain-containing protein n=1 Tax=Paramecium sonneborni TaxID=65129 RepID=A0A8S1RA13_9CILI|nr:unnamed protein product [Paramecium sonneborni]
MTKKKQSALQNQGKGKKKEQELIQVQNRIKSLTDICQQNEITFYTLQQNQFDLVILFKNVIFYCRQDSKLEIVDEKLTIEGKLYATILDNNQNPKYKIQQGKFALNLRKQDLNLIGNGIEYLGKSNIILNNNQDKPSKIQNINKSSQCRSKSQAPSKIIIKEEGKIINNNNNKQSKFTRGQIQFQKLPLWCKYNQQISVRDEQILINKNWLTSSIIDSFVFYLNLESDKQYFQKKLTDRNSIKRILFLPTSLTTNFGIQYDFIKAQDLFQQELLQFQEMNFELMRIYKKIGIPINKNNEHWQFLLFDYEKKNVELFDSLSFQFDDKLIKTLSKLLNLENCIINNKNDFGSQKTSYACGYYVCTFMYYQYKLQFDQNLKGHVYNENEITQLLLDVIKNQENQ